MLIWIAVLVLAAIGYVVYRSKYEDEIEKKGTRVAIDLVFMAIVIPTVLALALEASQASTAERMLEVVTDAVSEKSFTGTEEMSEFLVWKYQDIFESSEQDARKWVETFIDSLPERQHDSQQLLVNAKRLAANLEARWKPTYSWILLEFDTRVQALERKGQVKKVEQLPTPLIYVEHFPYSSFGIRKVIFPADNTITVTYKPARIIRGTLLNGGHLRFKEILGTDFSDDAFHVVFAPDYVSVFPGNKLYDDVENYRVETDPLKDERFKSVVRTGLNQLFSSMYLSPRNQDNQN